MTMIYQKEADAVVQQLLAMPQDQIEATLDELKQQKPVLYCVVCITINDMRAMATR